MQLQGELEIGHKRVYRNAIHAVYRIGLDEGVRGLQRGLFAAVHYQIAVNGTRFALYDIITNSIAKTLPNGYNKDGNPHGYVTTLSGATVGATAAFVSAPIYLVKVRLQSASTKVSVGLTQHSYSGFYQGLYHAARQDGVMALWKGVSAQIARVTIISAAQLSVYSSAKAYITNKNHLGFQDGIVSDFMASLLSGAVTAIAVNPVDLISTRICNNNGVEIYKNLRDCFSKTVQAEGIRGLYKGVGATYLRLAPHTTLTFVFLGAFRRAYEDYRHPQ